MWLKYLYLLIISLIFRDKIYATTVNVVVDSYSVLNEAFSIFENEFNEYSKREGLGITVAIHLFSEQDSSQRYHGFNSHLLSKKSKRYDIVAFDPLYLKNFSPYLVDLNQLPLEEYIEQYSTTEYDKITVYNNKRYGIPLFLIHSVLFYNSYYLKKYGESIPETWDDLINTSERILREERKKNKNSELIGYNGLFPDSENGMCSIYQFLYSFREEKNSTIPDFISKSAIDAFNKILEVRDKTATNELFKSEVVQTLELFQTGNIIFGNFFDTVTFPNYTTSSLPGKGNGIKGTVLGGYNMGINKYIDDDQKDAALTVIKFFLSERFQKEIIIKKLNLNTALRYLYDDEEVCKIKNCKSIKEYQLFIRPSNEMKDYNDYSEKLIRYLHEFFDGKKSAEKTLNLINDITKVYYFTIKSTTGLILLILSFINFLLISFSIVLLFLDKFKKYFRFMTNDLWIIYICGSALMIYSLFHHFGEMSNKKCTREYITYTIGNSMIYVPLLYKLIINFPKINKFSIMIKKFKYGFVSFFLLIQIILSIIIIERKTYKIKEINFDNNNKNFYRCETTENVGSSIILFQTIFNIVLYIGLCFLIFLEWNLEETFNDIRSFTVVAIINGITEILILILDHNTINNYYIDNLLNMGVKLIFIIINHTYVFYVRILLIMLKNEESEEDKLIYNELRYNRPSLKNNTLNSGSNSNSVKISASFHKSESEMLASRISKSSKALPNNIFLRILSYHYASRPIP